MRFNPDEYISVAERIEKFYQKFPQGRILTSAVEHDRESGFVLMRAEVYREPDDALPAATGHAYELKSAGHVQAGSYVEVCETSAVGRALALLGFEVKRGVASREEVQRGQRKAQTNGTVTAQIMDALDILAKDTAWLNEKVRTKYGLAGAASWAQLSDAHKGEVLSWLNQMVEKQVEKAKA